MNTEGKDVIKHQIRAKIEELEKLLMNLKFKETNQWDSCHVSDETTGHYQRKASINKNNIENTILYIERLQHAILNLTLIFDFVELTPPDSLERFMNNETFYTASFEELLSNLEGMAAK